MRKIVMLAALAAVLAVMGGSAQADEVYNNTCGGSGVALQPTWGTVFNGNMPVTLNWQQNCGDGKTIEVELQNNSSAHPLDWHDSACSGFPGCQQDYQFSTPSNLANHWVTRLSTGTFATPCPSDSGTKYRIHVWWSDGNDTSAGVAPSSSC